MSKTVFEAVGTYECQSELASDYMVVKKRQLPINIKNIFLGGSVPISVKVNWLVTIWWRKKRRLPINVKKGF
jgi:hypothetical protein